MTDDILDYPGALDDNIVKSRHGCVTAWFVFMMTVGVILAVIYFFFSEGTAEALGLESPFLIWGMGLMSICNVFLVWQLWQWKKIGFYGFIGTSVLAGLANLYIGIDIITTLTGLIGILFLYGILQIRKDDVAAWDHLE